MPLDLSFLKTVVPPVATLFVGIWANRRFAERPNVVTSWVHMSTFKVVLENQPPMMINAHSVLVRNLGRRPAEGVRLGHQVLPENIYVFPDIPWFIEKLPGGSQEIVVPRLLPGQQITVSYLYYPPLTFRNINTDVRSNDGYAKAVSLDPPWPRWFRNATLVLAGLGALTVASLGILAVRHWL
jgi:hypothetical protein